MKFLFFFWERKKRDSAQSPFSAALFYGKICDTNTHTYTHIFFVVPSVHSRYFPFVFYLWINKYPGKNCYAEDNDVILSVCLVITIIIEIPWYRIRNITLTLGVDVWWWSDGRMSVQKVQKCSKVKSSFSPYVISFVSRLIQHIFLMDFCFIFSIVDQINHPESGSSPSPTTVSKNYSYQRSAQHIFYVCVHNSVVEAYF